MSSSLNKPVKYSQTACPDNELKQGTLLGFAGGNPNFCLIRNHETNELDYIELQGHAYRIIFQYPNLYNKEISTKS